MKVRLTKDQKTKIANSDDVYRIMQAVLLRQSRIHRMREYFWVIGLDTDSNIQYLELVAVGKLNSVNVDPVEIFSFAVQKKCKRIILVHNHPAGNLRPSKEDVELTAKLAMGSHFLGLDILDHLIINEKEYSSIGHIASVKGMLKEVGRLKPAKKKQSR